MDKPPIRLAATVMLLREQGQNKRLEVLLLRRSKQLVFGADVWVFPGGAIDSDDFEQGVTVAQASGTQLYQAVQNAAVRETNEECGLDISGHTLLHYSHWTTPAGHKKRYATWFMLNISPVAGEIVVDDSEIVSHQWLCPKQAVAMVDDGRLKMMPPTYICLQELSAVTTIEQAASFTSSRPPPIFEPKLHETDDGRVTLYNGDDGYEQSDISLGRTQHRLLTVDGRFIYTNNQHLYQ